MSSKANQSNHQRPVIQVTCTPRPWDHPMICNLVNWLIGKKKQNAKKMTFWSLKTKNPKNKNHPELICVNDIGTVAFGNEYDDENKQIRRYFNPIRQLISDEDTEEERKEAKEANEQYLEFLVKLDEQIKEFCISKMVQDGESEKELRSLPYHGIISCMMDEATKQPKTYKVKKADGTEEIRVSKPRIGVTVLKAGDEGKLDEPYMDKDGNPRKWSDMKPGTLQDYTIVFDWLYKIKARWGLKIRLCKLRYLADAKAKPVFVPYDKNGPAPKVEVVMNKPEVNLLERIQKKKRDATEAGLEDRSSDETKKQKMSEGEQTSFKKGIVTHAELEDRSSEDTKKQKMTEGEQEETTDLVNLG